MLINSSHHERSLFRSKEFEIRCLIHSTNACIPDVAVAPVKSRFMVRTCSETREDSLIMATGPGWKIPLSSSTLYVVSVNPIVMAVYGQWHDESKGDGVRFVCHPFPFPFFSLSFKPPRGLIRKRVERGEKAGQHRN